MFQIITDKNDFPLTQESNWTYVVTVYSNIEVWSTGIKIRRSAWDKSANRRPRGERIRKWCPSPTWDHAIARSGATVQDRKAAFLIKQEFQVDYMSCTFLFSRHLSCHHKFFLTNSWRIPFLMHTWLIPFFMTWLLSFLMHTWLIPFLMNTWLIPFLMHTWLIPFLMHILLILFLMKPLAYFFLNECLADTNFDEH